MKSPLDDQYFMNKALEEAQKAYEKGEVPVGAVIVSDNQIIARGHNQTEQLTDTTAHAEILAITSASSYLNNKYLKNCTLYVTLEPCVMCAGALFWCQVSKVVYGASDPKRGFSTQNVALHPKTSLYKNILTDECEVLLNVFFKKLRAKS